MNSKELKVQEIKQRLKLAENYLESAKRSFKSGDFRLATDASYNALELAMKSAILTKQESLPKRHGGIVQFFSLLFIKDGPIEKGFGPKIINALGWRNKSRYDPVAKVTKSTAKISLNLGKELLAEISELIRPK